MYAMETSPRPPHAYLRGLIPRAMAIVALAGSVVSFNAAGAEAQERIPQPLSAEMLSKHNIPQDLPDIIGVGSDGFEGSQRHTPGAVWPSGPFNAALRENKDECMQLIRSKPSGKWAGCLIVAKNRMGPIQCGFAVAKTVSDKKVYDDPSNPCYDELLRMKDKSINDWTNNCKAVRYKCVDGTETQTTKMCTAWGKYAASRRDYSNMSYPETSGGLYYKVHTVEAGETVLWRKISDDNNAIAVRTERGGWVWMDRKECFPEELPTGAPQEKRKTQKTIAGAEPNKKR